MRKKLVFCVVAFVLLLAIVLFCYILSKKEDYTIEDVTKDADFASLYIHGTLPEKFEFGGAYNGKNRIFLFISNQLHLRKLIIGEKVEVLHEFENCPNLEFLEIGKDVISYWINYDNYNPNYAIKEFVVDPENPKFKVVGRCLIDKEKNRVIRAPMDVDTIPRDFAEIYIAAFLSTDIVLERNSLDHLSRIGHAAFRNCENITSVYFPENIELGGELFYGCSDLSYIYLPGTASKYSYVDSAPFYGLSPSATIYCGNFEDYLPLLSDWHQESDPFSVDSMEAFMTYWGFVDTQTLIFGQTADDMEKAILDKSK